MTRKAGKHGTGISYAYIHGRQGNTMLLQLADGTGLNPSLQTRKFGGKELDLTHGYVNYDFGARGYNPLLGVWDRMDQMCKKYYDENPYAYCGNDPMNKVDPNGREPIYDRLGNRLGFTNDGFLGKTGMPYVYLGERNDIDWGNFSRAELKKTFGDNIVNADHYVKSEELNEKDKATFLSNMATDIVKEYDNYEIEYEGKNYTFDFSKYGGIISYRKGFGNFNTSRPNPKTEWSFSIGNCYESYDLNGFNVLGSLLFHEWFGHAVMGWGDETKTHHKCFEMVQNSEFYKKNNFSYVRYIDNTYNQYKKNEE